MSKLDSEDREYVLGVFIAFAMIIVGGCFIVTPIIMATRWNQSACDGACGERRSGHVYKSTCYCDCESSDPVEIGYPCSGAGSDG